MRILDEESGKILNSILIMLEPDEAKQLVDLVDSLDPKDGSHIHVNDRYFRKNLTILIYTLDNLDNYSEEIRNIIKNEDG